MINNIYIDGSSQHKNGIIGIGIYNSSTGFELSLVKDGKDVYEAESEALEECIRYCQLNGIVKNSRIFTDSKHVHINLKEYVLELGFVDFIWIPRELNTVADRLSTSYKEYTKSSTIKISLNNNTVIKTTKIKETTKLKSLSKVQIIECLNQFSTEKKMKLLEKLNTSICNKNVWNYYFRNAKIPCKAKRKTYYYLIPLLIEKTKNNTNEEKLLEQISTEGLFSLLNEVKKETK